MDDDESFVVIVVDNVEIKASRQALVERSPYFQAMFNGSFIEQTQSRVVLKNINPEKLSHIVNRCVSYEECENPFEYYQIANYLQFVEDENELMKVIKKKWMTRDRSLRSVLFTKNIPELESVFIQAINLTAHYFNGVCHSTDFMKLGPDELCLILSNSNLVPINGEDQVVKCTLKWLVRRLDKGLSFNPEQLLRCIRCRHVQEEILLRLLMTIVRSTSGNESNLVRYLLSVVFGDCVECHKCFNILDGTSKCFSEASISLGRSIYSLPPRRARIVPAFPCNIIDNTGETQMGIVSWNNHANKFDIVCLLSDVCPSLNGALGFRLTTVGDKIVLTGGQKLARHNTWNNYVFIFDTITGDWEKPLKAPFYCWRHAVCNDGRNVYFVGGTDSFRAPRNKISALNITDGFWFEAGKVNSQNLSSTCCFLNDHIYLFSNDNNGSVSCYNVASRTLHLVKEIETHGEVTNAVVDGEFIYIVVSRKCVYRFKPKARAPALEHIVTFSHHSVCTTLCGSSIYHLSQNEETSKLFLEHYNLDDSTAEVLFEGLPKSTGFHLIKELLVPAIPICIMY